MLRWPIRNKLLLSFGLVVGMMLILMAGSYYSLRSFHDANLTLTDQLRELGAAKGLLEAVLRLQPLRASSMEGRAELAQKVRAARGELRHYFDELKKNALRGNRSGDGKDESGLSYGIDADLAGLLQELEPSIPVEHLFGGTPNFLKSHPEFGAGGDEGQDTVTARINRLHDHVSRLPDTLHRGFYLVLDGSRKAYQSSRIIIWSSAVAVLMLLMALATLLQRWVLDPVRLLEHGVRKVARGGLDERIHINTGDEMQALAEAFNDMTTRLRAMYNDLEQQVQERSKQLVRSERLAGVGFLAAGVAHEINNPLASIAFCSEALEHRLRPFLQAASHGDSKVIQNYLRMVQEEAFRCKRITEKLLDFSRCGDIQRSRTDLIGLVQGVVEMVRHMGKYRGKQVHFTPKEAVIALVDEQEIKQVVLNLVVNALDSMDPGGTLRIEVRATQGMAELIFADDGCGMTPEVLENIFEPFFTRRKEGKGTGLGLSITHRIVNQHHGDISATSLGEGQGSTFTVRLPLRPPSCALGDAEPSTAGGAAA